MVSAPAGGLGPSGNQTQSYENMSVGLAARPSDLLILILYLLLHLSRRDGSM
jgi:hypothetical protein